MFNIEIEWKIAKKLSQIFSPFGNWKKKKMCNLWDNQQKIKTITLCHWKAYVYLWLKEIRFPGGKSFVQFYIDWSSSKWWRFFEIKYNFNKLVQPEINAWTWAINSSKAWSKIEVIQKPTHSSEKEKKNKLSMDCTCTAESFIGLRVLLC